MSAEPAYGIGQFAELPVVDGLRDIIAKRPIGPDFDLQIDEEPVPDRLFGIRDPVVGVNFERFDNDAKHVPIVPDFGSVLLWNRPVMLYFAHN
jgi:hypothetical protein